LNHFESGLSVSDVEADFVLLLFFFYYFCEIIVANVVLSEAWLALRTIRDWFAAGKEKDNSL